MYLEFIKGWILSTVVPILKLLNPLNIRNTWKLIKVNAILLYMFSAEKLKAKGKIGSRKADVLAKAEYMVAARVVEDMDKLEECVKYLVKALDCLEMLGKKKSDEVAK